MMYYDFQVGENVYKLRLTTRSIVNLEKEIGMNPLSVFGDGKTMPTLSILLEVFHASLQQFNHGITKEKTYQLFDQWIEEGHDITQFVPIIIEVYRVSGLISEDDNEKN